MFALDLSFSDSLQESLDEIGAFLPKLIGAVIIFMIGWFIARLIRNVLHRVFTGLKVDTLVDKSGLGAPLEQAGYADSGLLLARLVYWFLMLMVLKMTFDTLDITEINEVLDDIIDYIPRVFVAIIIIFIVGALANWLRGVLSDMTSSFDWGNLVTNLAVAGVWIIGVFAALDQLNVAKTVVDTAFTVFIGSIGAIVVIKFGVGGVWAARDRFWPAVYDRFSSATSSTSGDSPPSASSST